MRSAQPSARQVVRPLSPAFVVVATAQGPAALRAHWGLVPPRRESRRAAGDGDPTDRAALEAVDASPHRRLVVEHRAVVALLGGRQRLARRGARPAHGLQAASAARGGRGPFQPVRERPGAGGTDVRSGDRLVGERRAVRPPRPTGHRRPGRANLVGWGRRTGAQPASLPAATSDREVAPPKALPGAHSVTHGRCSSTSICKRSRPSSTPAAPSVRICRGLTKATSPRAAWGRAVGGFRPRGGATRSLWSLQWRLGSTCSCAPRAAGSRSESGSTYVGSGRAQPVPVWRRPHRSGKALRSAARNRFQSRWPSLVSALVGTRGKSFLIPR